MKTLAQIEAYAQEAAFKLYFCNVGEADWPADPIACMAEHDLEGKMVIWSVFENDSLEFISQQVDSTYEDFKAAMLWAQENA